MNRGGDREAASEEEKRTSIYTVRERDRYRHALCTLGRLKMYGSRKEREYSEGTIIP